MAVEIVFDNATFEDVQRLNEALAGWAPFRDSEVVVFDAEEAKSPGMLIGPGVVTASFRVSIVDRNDELWSLS